MLRNMWGTPFSFPAAPGQLEKSKTTKTKKTKPRTPTRLLKTYALLKKLFKFLVLYRLEKNFSLKLGQIIYYIYLGNIYS